jgi:cytoskeletal protein CcmA (bactofilin family)
VTATSPIVAPTPSRGRGGAISDRGIARHESLDSEQWTLRGAAKVVHDVDVGAGDLDGTVSVGGSLRAETLTSAGRLDVAGAVEVRGTLSGRGEIRGGATLHVGDVTLRGSLQVLGAVSVDRRLEVVGAVRAASLTASELRVEGDVEIPDTVRAAAVDLRLRGGSRVGAVEGGTVRIAGHVPNLLDKALGHHSSVTVGRIEADRAQLEGVHVDLVHAPEIVLGPGCHVTIVEGTVTHRHPTSHVGPESRSPPPYGLRR